MQSADGDRGSKQVLAVHMASWIVVAKFGRYHVQCFLGWAQIPIL